MNPFYSFLRSIGYLLTGRLSFPGKRVGEVYRMEDGKDFVVFRHAIVNRKLNGQSPAIFKVRFLLANMAPEKNKVFSLIPIPFFVGLPGFRAKFWMLDEKEGYFQGLYEWNNVIDAKNYSQSFAMRFMKKRSIPGTTHFEILEDRLLEDYIETLEKI